MASNDNILYLPPRKRPMLPPKKDSSEYIIIIREQDGTVFYSSSLDDANDMLDMIDAVYNRLLPVDFNFTPED